MPKLTILLGDDHALVRQGLRRILEERPDWEVVAEVGDGRERCAAALKPRVAVLDVGMPLLNGIDATQQIVRKVPETRVLILSMHSDEAYVTRALQLCYRVHAEGFGRRGPLEGRRVGCNRSSLF